MLALLYRMLLYSIYASSSKTCVIIELVVFSGLSGDDASSTHLVVILFMIDFVKLYNINLIILYIYTIIFIATCLVCHYYQSHSTEGLAPKVFIMTVSGKTIFFNFSVDRLCHRANLPSSLELTTRS